MKNRREMIAGTMGLVAASAASHTAAEARAQREYDAANAFLYDYLFVEVPRRGGGIGGGVGAGPGGTGSAALFLSFLNSAGAGAIAAAGGEVLGYFTPLIGWSSEQLAILIRWTRVAPDRERVLAVITNHVSAQRIERCCQSKANRSLHDARRPTGAAA